MAKNTRSPLPFLMLLATLWLVQSIPLWFPCELPVRELSLVNTPEQVYEQSISENEVSQRNEIRMEIYIP